MKIMMYQLAGIALYEVINVVHWFEPLVRMFVPGKYHVDTVKL